MVAGSNWRAVRTGRLSIAKPTAAVLSMALLVSACGDSGDSDLNSSSEDGRGDISSEGQDQDELESSTGDADAEIGEEDSDETEDDAAAEEPTPAQVVDHRTLDPADAQPDADGSCLVGTWLINEEEMNRWYDGLEATADGVSFDITGSVTVEFTADRSFTYTPTFVMSMDANGVTGSGDTSGTLKGTWSASDGLVATDITEDNMTVDVRVAGVSIDTGGPGLTDDPIVEAPYDCATDEPVLFFNDGSGGRVPMRLTPA